jgi:hypothetical protein
MKKRSIFLIAFLSVSIYSFSQLNRSESISISSLFQIDSSEFFIFGKLIDKSTKAKYGASTKVFNGYTNAYVYNSKTKKILSMFPNGITLIFPFYDNFYNMVYTYGQALKQSVIQKNYIIFLVQDADLNGDGILDDDDPASIYISKSNGESLTKISSNELNVISWTFARDSNTILFTAQKDSNKDKKFINEDQLLYQVDLENDISKIKVTQVIF